MEVSRIQSEIEVAFGDLPYPGDKNIVASPQHCDECRYTAEFFQSKHWREVAYGQQELPVGWGGISFLTPQAWHFYLPAYMITALHEGTTFPDVAGSTLFHLTPAPVSDEKYFQERVPSLSERQKDSIASFVNFICQKLPNEYSERCKLVKEFWQRPRANQ